MEKKATHTHTLEAIKIRECVKKKKTKKANKILLAVMCVFVCVCEDEAKTKGKRQKVLVKQAGRQAGRACQLLRKSALAAGRPEEAGNRQAA